MTKIINLFGGSGLGKSTTAAATFAELTLFIETLIGNSKI